ncbi:hypothetical protein SSX86_023535 [Deinandra increscens subsp. villosa]|uniref:Beta-galactosidase galactose-binding domain-containing protein n=1 Tax=Deinandra increscens subsp. villosa TaxID=3103831 RepID=A0AAP0GPZ2_9ASTR
MQIPNRKKASDSGPPRRAVAASASGLPPADFSVSHTHRLTVSQFGREDPLTEQQQQQEEGHQLQISQVKELMLHMAYFNEPHGDEPLALDMNSMGKGEAWINGESIGRYWSTYANGDCQGCHYDMYS